MSLKTAWLLADIELAAGVAMPLVAAFYFICAPGFMDPTFFTYSRLSLLVPAIGLAGFVLGEVWLIRLYRGLPHDPDARWRYRDRD